jgi:hypothetical protein
MATIERAAPRAKRRAVSALARRKSPLAKIAEP